MNVAKSLAVEKQKIGNMLITCKNRYTFDRWYTMLDGSELVTEDTIYDFGEDIALYSCLTKR